MSLDNFVVMYLDYLNNFLTVSAFADHYGIKLSDAIKIVEAGQLIASVNLN